jgi:hypothetical protein
MGPIVGLCVGIIFTQFCFRLIALPLSLMHLCVFKCIFVLYQIRHLLDLNMIKSLSFVYEERIIMCHVCLICILNVKIRVI